MKRFKPYLLEYLTDKQREHYRGVQMSDKARADTDHYFGVGNDKVHGEIKHDDKSEIHKQLENHIGRDLSHDEYRTGLTKDKYGRDVKIGKIIKDANLRNQFDKDPARKMSPTMKTTTVRGVEVAGQSNPESNPEHPNGHSWHDISCKNIETGIHRRKLSGEIQHGTVVHFVHDHNGQEIYRATLQPHHNDNGDVAYDLDAEYGVKHPKFTEDARRVAKDLSGEYRPGRYVKDGRVYNDSGHLSMFHPATESKHIFDALKNGDHESKYAVLEHPELKPEHITHVLKHEENANIRQKALRRTTVVTPEHINTALKDPVASVRIQALRNPYHVTSEHLTNALKNDSAPVVKQEAIAHPKIEEHHIEYALKNDSDIARNAIRHPNATSKNVTQALDHDDPVVRINALERNSLITPAHIDKAINDKNEDVRIVAAQHPNLGTKQLDNILKNEKSPIVKYHALAAHNNVSPAHLHKIITSDAPRMLKTKAIEHPNLSNESIHHILKNGDAEEQYDAIQRPNLSPENLDYAVHHVTGRDVRNAITRNPNLTPKHIEHMLKNDTDTAKIRRLVWHPNTTSEMVDNIIKNHPNEQARQAAFEGGRFITPKHVSHVMKHDTSPIVRKAALQHPDATEEHLKDALDNDPDHTVRSTADLELHRLQRRRAMYHIPAYDKNE